MLIISVKYLLIAKLGEIEYDVKPSKQLHLQK
jgi:hypothetical protein